MVPGSDMHLLDECLGPLLPVYNLGMTVLLLLSMYGEIFLCSHLWCGAGALKLPWRASSQGQVAAQGQKVLVLLREQQ